MVLSELKNGEKAKIISIQTGKGAKNRLVDFGLIPGTEIELISAYPFRGPILLKIGSSHVALGQKVAKDVEVEKSVN